MYEEAQGQARGCVREEECRGKEGGGWPGVLEERRLMIGGPGMATMKARGKECEMWMVEGTARCGGHRQ